MRIGGLRSAEGLLMGLVVGLTAACGDDATSTEPPGPPIEEECASGEILAVDGSCIGVGVDPGSCAEGFVHDGDGACLAMLPPAPCEPGMMAVPGDEACREVMACGDGPWGDLPVDAATIYVDAQYTAPDANGSANQPFPTILAAVAAAPAGSLIAVAAGDYVGDVTSSKPLQIWGRCPAMVTVTGSGGPAALRLTAGADGSVIGGLAVTGPQAGMGVLGVADVVIDAVWLHDLGDAGLGTAAPASYTLRNSLVERARLAGIINSGVTGTIEGCQVRETEAIASGFGFGISAQPSTVANEPGSLIVRRTWVDRATEIGVYVFGREQALLDGVVVSGTRVRASDQTFGRGLNVQDDGATGDRPLATVTRSWFTQNTQIGVFAAGADLVLEDTAIDDTLPEPVGDGMGRGINIQIDTDSLVETTATISRTRVRRSTSNGLFVASAAANVTGLWVSDTFVSAIGPPWGIGVQSQSQPNLARAALSLGDSLVTGSLQFGIALLDTDASVARSTVTTTEPGPAGLHGDGLAVLDYAATAAPTSLQGLTIRDNARGGLAVFGATVGLGGSQLTCNALDLVSATILESMELGTIQDEGGNTCGCDDLGDCKIVQAELAPPSPLPL